MYGDCQVMSSLGGGNMITSSDGLFTSPSPIRNPNHLGFLSSMPFHHHFPSLIPKEEVGVGVLGLGKEEDIMESGGSGSGHVDGLSCGEEHDNDKLNHHPKPQLENPQSKKKRYHRHTARQIQEMEALFKECPHPDDKQRMRLSQDLGLKPRQVKFWFQNRRTQMKAQQDRSDNVVLRAENENLKNENFRLQAAIRNVVCPNCGGPALLGEMSFDEQHLRLENARLKDELERLSCIASRYGHRSVQPLGSTPPWLIPSLDLDMGMYSRHFNDPMGDVISALPPPPPPMPDSSYPTFLIMDQEKHLALELAMTAMDELVRMCHMNEPLWTRSGDEEVLDLEEHAKMFPPWPMDLKPVNHDEFRTEATRDSALVIMNSITLVDAFMDANKWVELFPSIVSKARTIQIISPGVSGLVNGSLHLMYAEFQVLSPLVPTRETHFLRYCQQNIEAGTWTVVDFPVDGFHDVVQLSSTGYIRRPSGCVIQDMPNGYSRVTWIEHAEVENKQVHPIFQQFVHSGSAFGAHRWLSVLQRQCERLASLMAKNISNLGVIPTPEARKNMMKLAQRMVRTFCSNISTSDEVQSWTSLSDSPEDTVRIMTRKTAEPGQPNGVILTAVSTTWLPFTHHQVFDLLTDEQRRSQLDILSSGNSLHEVAHIANGSHPRNCVSLLRINAASNSSQNVELMLQESSTHPTGGSLIVYATVDVDAVQVAMSGDDPSFIPLLPMGFVVLPASASTSASPATPDNNNNEGSGADKSTKPSMDGCLLTAALQVVASAIPSAKLNLSSVTAINNHLCSAVQQISTALGSGSAAAGGASEALKAEP
ncbi:Homeobox-leucine zipper protein ROC3 [Acorus calamus]|uniref:Homeobox-leucine zipper protein ROC3 n=1 Tax=Acorus calamus TaxID=4465 RepID=A0AAV9CC58_ACOCL|nr:Homeobox-leucine zipper protein ROC3 [Acorus calamus]